MMEGFEREWTYTDSQHRVARYTNLAPGDYTFRVKASNNDGVWNEEGTSIAITVTPPWWETWWFYTLCTVGVLGIFGLVFRNQADKLHKERSFALALQEREEKYRILFESFDSVIRPKVALNLLNLSR